MLKNDLKNHCFGVTWKSRQHYREAQKIIAPNVFQLLTLRPPKRTNLSVSEGSSAGAMWVSGMSEASVANPDEGAEQCEATEELQLRC